MQVNRVSEIGAYDAKTRLPELLRKVQLGEEYLITNRGRPVARLIPAVPVTTKRPVSVVIKEILSFKPQVDCSHWSTEDLRKEGRR